MPPEFSASLCVDLCQCTSFESGEASIIIGVPKKGRRWSALVMLEQPLSSPQPTQSGQRSPRITALSWGRIAVEGVGTFRDAKVFPGGAREWDWKETGTAHRPGIQPADVTELLDHGATTILLSQGFLSQLQVCPETLQLLAERHVRTYVLRTPKAVELYNQLCEHEQVAGLFHTTC